jgi:GAF domain-containing protein
MRLTEYSNINEGASTNRLLRTLLIISIVTDAAALGASAYGGFGRQYLIPIGTLLLLAIVSLLFLLRGNSFPAQVLLPSSLFVVITYIIAFPPGYGLHDINLLAYAVVISLAGLTLGQRGALAFTILIILAVFAIGIAEINGIIVSPTSALTLPVSPIAISIVILAITFIQRALINLLNDSVQRARNSEKEVVERNKELQTLSAGLEKLVEVRTSELDRANQRSEHRAKQFEAISQVSRAINQTQNLHDLLPKITEVISQQFNFYHVGIFLLDVNNEYAVLAAANSEGGKKMLDRGHQLKVGQVGIVGNVAGTGVPRIALDTGADAIYFNNPDLPETRSEMALPLFRTGQQLIGVMDVQSTQANAFGQDDIQILTTLADQVSIAISNARLYEDTQKALLESETLYRRDIQSGWNKFTRSQNVLGIRRQGSKANLLSEPLDLPGALEVSRSGNIYQRKADGVNNSSQLTIPMKLRDEVVGILNVKTDGDRLWTVDEIDIITAIIERAALSIDNARLLDESQKRATLEQTIGEMSTRIGAGTEVEAILRTTVRELGAQISGAQISVELGNERE